MRRNVIIAALIGVIGFLIYSHYSERVTPSSIEQLESIYNSDLNRIYGPLDSTPVSDLEDRLSMLREEMLSNISSNPSSAYKYRPGIALSNELLAAVRQKGKYQEKLDTDLSNFSSTLLARTETERDRIDKARKLEIERALNKQWMASLPLSRQRSLKLFRDMETAQK